MQLIENGDRVLFYGDSITDADRVREVAEDLGGGYPRDVKALFESLFPQLRVSWLNRGISGNRACDLLRRYDEDVRALAPDVISILIGINDTWRRYDSNDPTSTEVFRENYEMLLRQIKKDMPRTKIVLIQPFVLHSSSDRIAWHEDLDPKVEAIAELAKQYADGYLRLGALYDGLISETYSVIQLAEDGVHPTALGHKLIAKAWVELVMG